MEYLVKSFELPEVADGVVVGTTPSVVQDIPNQVPIADDRDPVSTCSLGKGCEILKATVEDRRQSCAKAGVRPYGTKSLP